MIYYAEPSVGYDEIKAVNRVLKSKTLTQGNETIRFERNFSKITKSKYSVSFNSCTSALISACASLNISSKDEVWTTPNTFVASSNCALYCGAKVDFVDIDKDTWNMCPDKLRIKLEESKQKNLLPKAVIPVHFSGQPTIQEEIYKLSKEYGFIIIEDASHSIGSSRNNEPSGSCKWSDIAIFSFHPVKMITTGEGGMALTNNEEYAKKMDLFRSHGISRDSNFLEKNDLPKYYYEQHSLGYNYRMTDIHAALGISQLRKLDKFIDTRNKIALRYDSELKELPLHLPYIAEGNKSSYHLYVIKVKDTFSKQKSRDKIYSELIEMGIGVNLHYLPVHLHPYYRKLGFFDNQYPVSENYADNALSIPIFYSLTDDQQTKVIDSIKQALK